MKKLAQCVCYLAILFNSHFVMAENETSYAKFGGAITEQAVADFENKYNDKQITRLLISSQGGEGLAAIRLGSWVYSRRIEVEVRTLCMSACANYVFPAGTKKIIYPGSLVLWHGSAEQRDMRMIVSNYELIAEQKQAGNTLSSVDEEYLNKYKRAYEGITLMRQRQAEFFKLVGVDGRIASLGQEPFDFGVDSWTATPEVMRLYGLLDVDAPKGYATREYLEKNTLINMLLAGVVLTFEGEDKENLKGSIVKSLPLRKVER